jgi:L-lysine exporter family protein LysE/ArgO
MMTLAMQRSYWSGFWLGMGSCIGDLVYAVLALAGMTALLQLAAVRWGMWIGASVVLLVLAIRMAVSAFRSVQLGSTTRDPRTERDR